MKHLLILPLLLLTACAKKPAPVVTEAPVEVAEQAPYKPVLLTKQPVQNLFFDFDVDTLLPGQKRLMPYLNRWAEANNVTVLVTGYADTVGTDAYNCALSERRASAVAAHLTRATVSVGCETTKFGSDKMNRRVTLEAK